MEPKKKSKIRKRLRLNLKPLIEQHGWDIKQFAIHAGLSYPAAHGHANNRYSRIEFETLEKLCTVFDCEVEHLFVWD